MSGVLVGVGEGDNNTFNPPDVLLFFLFLALFHFSSSFFWFYGPPALWAFELWLRTSREEPLFFILPQGVFYWGGRHVAADMKYRSVTECRVWIRNTVKTRSCRIFVIYQQTDQHQMINQDSSRLNSDLTINVKTCCFIRPHAFCC